MQAFQKRTEAKLANEQEKTLAAYRKHAEKVAFAKRPTDADVATLAELGEKLGLDAGEIDGDLAAIQRRRELEAKADETKKVLDDAKAECEECQRWLTPDGELYKLRLKYIQRNMDGQNRMAEASNKLVELRTVQNGNPRLWNR